MRAGAGACAAVAVALLVLVPTYALAGAPGRVVFSGSREAGLVASRAPIPAALTEPWAARSGFSSEFAQEAPDSGPIDGNVTVHLTLAPSNPGLFVPPPIGSVPLSNAQISDRFGLSAPAYDRLAGYFAARGLAISYRDPARLAMAVSGPASEIGSAFGTELVGGVLDGAPVRYPNVVPSLPSPYANEVSAISGLSDGFDRFELPLAGVQRIGPSAVGPARTTTAITASAVHLAYGLDDLYNYSGGTHFASSEAIAILLWGDGFDPNDIRTFYADDYPGGFPQINVSWYPVAGAPSPSAASVDDPSHSPQELTLDLEWSGSAAPGATLDAVYAPDGPASRGYSPDDANMETGLNTAISLAHVVALSMSFGTPDHSDLSFQAAFETGFAVAAQHGITVLAASGDNGGQPIGGSCPSGGPAPQYPAASPQVLAVGGSSPVLNLSVFGAVTGLASETAWNGSGGGYSPTYGIPTWQSNSSAGPTIRAGGHRGLADVAGPATFNRFFFAGAPMAGNGTSFATPFWAGMIAEMDALLPHPLGFLDPTLYAIGTEESSGSKAPGLVDVQGESGPACVASGAGWDPATGWGTPRAGILFDDLVATLVDLNVTVSPSDVAPGGSVSIDANVLNASSHLPIAALPIDVALDAPSGYLGPCGSGLPSAVATSDADGNASSSLSVPFCYLGSSLVVTVTVAADGYFGSHTETIRVNLLGIGGLVALASDYPYNIVLFAGIMAAAILLGVFLGRVRRNHRRRRAAAGRPGTPVANSPAPPPAADPGGPEPTGEAPIAPAAPPPPTAAPAPPGLDPRDDGSVPGRASPPT